MSVKKIQGKVIECNELEWGVEFDDGFVAICSDEDEAQIMAAMTNGELRVREVWISAWAELDE